MANVSTAQLADALNLTERRVQQLVKEGLPQIERNRYDLGQCYYWYVRFLQRALQKNQPDPLTPPTRYQTYRERLLDAQASMEEFELHKRRSLLMPTVVYEKALNGWANVIRQHVMSLPDRLSAMLVGLDRRAIFETIDRECRAELTALATEDYVNAEPTNEMATSSASSSPA